MCNNKEVQEWVNTNVYRIVGIGSSSNQVVCIIGLFGRVGRSRLVVCMGILVELDVLVWMGVIGVNGASQLGEGELCVVIVGIWYILCVIGVGIRWGYRRKIRGMKIVCGVGETDSGFFRSDLLKNIKTTPTYMILKIKK